MSRTTRRTHFNKKSRFFHHYWECFSKQELMDKEWITEYKYYSDSYYTKTCKDRKQVLKNFADRELRQSFRIAAQRICLDIEHAEVVNFEDKPRSIKWDLH